VFDFCFSQINLPIHLSIISLTVRNKNTNLFKIARYNGVIRFGVSVDMKNINIINKNPNLFTDYDT